MGELQDNRTPTGKDAMSAAKEAQLEAQAMADIAAEEARELVDFFGAELKRCAEARNRADIPRNMAFEFALQRRERCVSWAFSQAEKKLKCCKIAQRAAYGR